MVCSLQSIAARLTLCLRSSFIELRDRCPLRTINFNSFVEMEQQSLLVPKCSQCLNAFFYRYRIVRAPHFTRISFVMCFGQIFDSFQYFWIRQPISWIYKIKQYYKILILSQKLASLQRQNVIVIRQSIGSWLLAYEIDINFVFLDGTIFQNTLDFNF